MVNTQLARADFQICNQWTVDTEGDKFKNGAPKWIIDESTGKRYLNEGSSSLRIKACCLATFGCVGNIFCSISSQGDRVARIFGACAISCCKCACGDRARKAGMDALKLLVSPFTYLATQISACYGCWVSPLDGRKMYATWDAIHHDGSVSCAPCFQPDAQKHLLEGDIEMQGSY